MAREYKERNYRREHFTEGRMSFTAVFRKSDLWITVDRKSYCEQMPGECISILSSLWDEMEAYIEADPGYAKALTPYPVSPDAPQIIRDMAASSAHAGVGPMASVAGAVSRHLAVRLAEKLPYKEIIVENGGDIYSDFTQDLFVSVFAGESPLSGKIALKIPHKYSPLGICTSSGTVGPSLSFGTADAVMVVCRDVILADACATAFANLIQTKEDIKNVIEQMGAVPEILSGIAIKDDKIGITGEIGFEITG